MMDAIIGVDVGTKRIGVAVATVGVASPLTVVQRIGDDATDAVAIAAIALERGASRAVVGHPRRMDGSVGPAAEAAERFAEALRACGLTVALWDERLTTVEAERVLIQAGTRRENRKKVVDKLAATVILQAYLDAGPGR